MADTKPNRDNFPALLDSLNGSRSILTFLSVASDDFDKLGDTADEGVANMLNTMRGGLACVINNLEDGSFQVV